MVQNYGKVKSNKTGEVFTVEKYADYNGQPVYELYDADECLAKTLNMESFCYNYTRI